MIVIINSDIFCLQEGTVSWQQLLMAPAQQMLVIERMHSGARRFVVLDLGTPVLLTDLLIPACPELLSLSIDIWTRAEEVDAQRLVVASDIGTKTLVMSDIQPPPICQFIKVFIIFFFYLDAILVPILFIDLFKSCKFSIFNSSVNYWNLVYLFL